MAACARAMTSISARVTAGAARRRGVRCPGKPQRLPRIRWLIPGLSCRVTMAFTVRAVHRL